MRFRIVSAALLLAITGQGTAASATPAAKQHVSVKVSIDRDCGIVFTTVWRDVVSPFGSQGWGSVEQTIEDFLPGDPRTFVSLIKTGGATSNAAISGTYTTEWQATPVTGPKHVLRFSPDFQMADGRILLGDTDVNPYSREVSARCGSPLHLISGTVSTTG